MAKTRGVDAKLARIQALRKEPVSPSLAVALRKFLGDASNFVVEEAAALASQAGLAELAPDLEAAFDRFMVDPEDTDKLCRAKLAVIEALYQLEFERQEPFLRAIRHVQFEPVWGGTQDTAPALRGAGAFGLVRVGHRDILILLADLLADKEKVARVAAVQALDNTGSPAAIPLLRFKARVGDKEPEVTCECLTALLKMEAEAVEFVAEFLRAGDEAVREGAALALGETRRPGAFEILREAATDLPTGSLQEVVFLALAMLRQPAAIDFLVAQIAGKKTAHSALSALAIHRHNDGIKERVAKAVTQSRDAAFQAWFTEKYDRA
jgi:HEAT repeat protein